MKVSAEQIKKIVSSGGQLTPSEAVVDGAMIRLLDKDLVERVSKDVLAMPDREHLVEEVKAKLASGNYRPSGDEIADAMIRRMVADRVR